MGFNSFFAILIILSLQTHAGKSTDHYPTILDETAMKNGADGRENINPCEDFYHFACGNWIDETRIPAEKRSVYRQSTPLEDATDKNLNKILQAYANGNFSIRTKNAKKLADFYTSCMNAEQSSAASVDYIKQQIQKFKTMKSKKERSELIAKLSLLGANVFFDFFSIQSLNDSTQVIGNLSQGGFALEERNYYFDTDENAIETRQKYKNHIAQIFYLLGYNQRDAQQIARHVFRVETKLASAAYSYIDANDPSKTNHPMRVRNLQKLMPHFDWEIYFKTLGLTKIYEVNVDEPEFFQNLDKVLSRIDEGDFTHYLVWHLLDQYAPELGGAFEKAHFNFWGRYMNGSKKMEPRWQLCTKATEQFMGYALAESYVKTFNGDAIKKKASFLIYQIKNTFRDNLENISHGPEAWLDDHTAMGALEKIDRMTEKTGAPVNWRNYDNLQLSSSNYLSNSMRISRFETLRDLAKIGKPVDKSEWLMMPWEVNAYYDRSNNEFVFPFGILQPPSLDLRASDGANLGAFGGGTIGHELLHGFDNNGSKYDSRGNLKNWWSPTTQKMFEEKSQCYIQQANAYTIKEVGLNVDGEQTLEENLADQGGVKLGYMALDKILKTRAPASPWRGKYSERQQYWIAYAQSWCSKITPESLRSQMISEEHPPSEFRVNAVMMNRPEFARDFNCSAGSRMAPVTQCSIW